MARLLVLYYSAYGHIETMANAVAEGAREGGASVDIKRVPELVPEDVAKKSYFKVDQKAPIAKIEDLAKYDAIVVGVGTRFGPLASQNGQFSRPGRRSLDAWRITWKGRGSIHLFCYTARWPGDDTLFDHYESFAFRDGNRWPRLRSRRTDDSLRDCRRFSLRRHDDCRRGWFAAADGERASGG